jgi:hypothetical protein
MRKKITHTYTHSLKGRRFDARAVTQQTIVPSLPAVTCDKQKPVLWPTREYLKPRKTSIHHPLLLCWMTRLVFVKTEHKGTWHTSLMFFLDYYLVIFSSNLLVVIYSHTPFSKVFLAFQTL